MHLQLVKSTPVITNLTAPHVLSTSESTPHTIHAFFAGRIRPPWRYNGETDENHAAVLNASASIVLTLDVYSHVLPDMQKAATDKLEKLLFKRTGTLNT